MHILITGASKGIGKFLAEKLRAEKHQVYGTYYRTTPDEEPIYNMDQVNITDEVQLATWMASSTEKAEDIALINCAGVNYSVMLHKSDPDTWMRVLDTNLKAAYLMMKQILPMMREKRFGRIIHLSSVVPQIGVAGTSAYSASKSGLWGLTRAAAVENAKYGITVNTLNLGYFNIGMIKEVPPDILSSIIDRIPQGKLGDPLNILNAVRFLLDSDYITGSQIDLNGGLY
jgi:acetoacetyl-CoA reductase/3-oxoacyl-[acyl-carrier protein] reductase